MGRGGAAKGIEAAGQPKAWLRGGQPWEVGVDSRGELSVPENLLSRMRFI